MKYLLAILFLFTLIVQPNFADDVCEIKPSEYTHSYIEVDSNVNMRNLPCTTESKILGVAESGERFHVVGEVTDFYKIALEYGEYVWVWKNAVQEVEVSLNQEDKDRANQFVELVEDIVNKQGNEINNDFILGLKTFVNNYNLSQKELLLFDEIFYLFHMKIDQNTDIDIGNNGEETQEEIIQEEETVQENETEYLHDFKINKTQAINYWLDLNNEVRSQKGIYEYTFNQTLNNSAQSWSNTQRDNSLATHKRNLGDSYYDYSKITKWLADESVVCKNIDKYTHTENVGWGAYYCDQDDCTAELENAMSRTFDFYMSEEFDEYQPHYLSIVNEYFTEIGVGIAIEETKENYFEFYTTIHYCTELQ